MGSLGAQPQQLWHPAIKRSARLWQLCHLGCKQVFKIKKGLDKNGDTRFSSNCNMLSSVRKNKAPLASTVVLPKFNANSERMKVSPCNQCNIVGMLVNLIRPTCVNHS